MTFAFNEDRLWDWAVGMANHLSLLSKDPSTKVGAVIFDDKRRLVSGGYNGFPRGLEDSDARLNDRDTKLKMTLHAEQNAIAFATAPLVGATLFCTHPCCARCTAQIIQVGIRHVCWPMPSPDFIERWRDDLVLANTMFEESGVQIHVR